MSDDEDNDGTPTITLSGNDWLNEIPPKQVEPNS